MSEKTETINPSEGMDRSVYGRFIAWAKGDKAQTVAAFLLILGSLIYQVWQDPEQLEFVKIIAILFITTAIVEEFFELKGKNVTLEKDKVNLERDKLTLSNTVMKIEKALQAGFIKNKHSFHYDVMGLFLNKIEDYLDGDELDSNVVKTYREMIGTILSKSKKYAGLIENKYKDFLEEMLSDRAQADVPISEFSAMLIKDKLTQSKESEFKTSIEENINAVEDFNKDHTIEE